MGVRIADFRLWNTKDLNTPQIHSDARRDRVILQISFLMNPVLCILFFSSCFFVSWWLHFM